VAVASGSGIGDRPLLCSVSELSLGSSKMTAEKKQSSKKKEETGCWTTVRVPLGLDRGKVQLRGFAWPVAERVPDPDPHQVCRPRF
jgi:membrane protein implicated in regulation of membrane protease activity